jgi:hypothetical protein
MKKYDRARLFSRPDLEERGWTRTMMNRHLPDPDDHRDNPFYKCAGAMPLWLRSRIHRIEKNKGFIRDMERANARRAKRKATVHSAPEQAATPEQNTEREARFAAAAANLRAHRAEMAMNY